jgi:hypothetical protein
LENNLTERQSAKGFKELPEPTPLFPLFLSAIPVRSGSMATHTDTPRKINTLMWVGAAIIAVLLALFLVGGGHNNGQPSAPSGPGNAMQNDQGR